jgi:hypothetical protein
MDWLSKDVVGKMQAKAARLEELTPEDMNAVIETAHGTITTYLARLADEQEAAERRAVRIAEILESIELGGAVRAVIAAHRHGRKG